MSKQLKIIITSIILIVLLAIGISAFSAYERDHRGTVNLTFQLRQTKLISARFNNKLVQPDNSKTPSQSKYVYNLQSGHYALTVNESGYKQFSANFTLRPNGDVLIQVNLKPAIKPSASDLNQIVTQATGSTSPASLSSQLPPGTAITAVRYFDNNTWAIVSLDENSGIGILYFVDHYSSSLGRWIIISAPNDNFDYTNVRTMPPDVQNYINNNYYVARS